MNHELWMLVARGILGKIVSDARAIASRDSRAVAWALGVFPMVQYRDAYVACGYFPSRDVMDALARYVDRRVYDPVIAEEAHLATGVAVVGDAITADGAPEGWEHHVYEWTDPVFTHLGPLVDNATPGPGTYVVVMHDSVGAPGLPCQFLTIA